MAWTVTDRGVFTAHDSGVDWTTGAFTPDGNALLLLLVYTTENITSAEGQDDGSAWIQLWQETDVPDTNDTLEIWGCFTGGSPSSGTVTVTIPETWDIAATLLEIQEGVNGVDVSGSVADAFGTRDLDYGYDVRTPQLTLGAFADANNLTLAWHAIYGNISGTFEGSYTELNQVGSEQHVILPGWLGSEDNTVDGTLENWIYSAFWGVEIKQGAAAGDLSVDEFESVGLAEDIAAALSDLGIDENEAISVLEDINTELSLILEQEGFRWRDDDDSESAAAWLVDQDVDTTRLREVNIRLRFLINATGDHDSKQFKIQYKKTSDATWRDMPESL